ncbi:MAG: tyrosine-type recombinase/integrase [Erysipelotrichaceae bacterium]|nr:tyrosine-type recombinase/integrase [Erysipelotrichaceae bacterium]
MAKKLERRTKNTLCGIIRNSHAANLINDGVNVVAVSRRLGHSDVSMTLKVYMQLFQRTDIELAKKTGKIFSRSSHRDQITSI